jgi:hypothetical protein
MFYHTFPRPKRGQDSIQKGLKILESFLKSGILLVPEIITYKHEGKEYYAAQSRLCMTQIDISELKAHEKYFGGFHLEFTNHKAYLLGAIPVFYLPCAEPDRVEWPLKKLASGYLCQLYKLQSFCAYIQELNEMVKGETVPDADHMINVKQLLDTLDIIQNLISGATPGESRKDIGSYMDNFLGALQGIGALLYPTDKDIDGDMKTCTTSVRGNGGLMRVSV